MGLLQRATDVAHATPRDAKATGAEKVKTLTPAQAEAAWRDAMLAELRLMRQTSTDVAARGSGQIVNSVLDVRTFAFPASGVVVFDYHVAAGSVQVANLSGSASVTVQAGTQTSETPPTSGTGVQVVPAQSWMSVPIGARAVTLYGAAGERVSLQVFAGMQAYGVAG